MRLEVRQNNRDFNNSSHEITDDSWVLNRFRLGLTIAPNSWVKVYGQTQDSREAFSQRPNVPGLNGADGDDHFDLRQAYVAIGDLKKFPLQVTVGRQAITYGDARLVADSKWGNFGRTFDAARVRFEEPHFWVEGFFMRPVQIERGQFNESDSADNFGGVYFSTDYGTKQAIDFYVFYRDKKDNQPELDPHEQDRSTGHLERTGRPIRNHWCAHQESTPIDNGWDYIGEFVYEVGDVGRRSQLQAI
jgi:hypothetical protein